MALQGRVQQVTTRLVGSPLDGDHPAGATYISIADSSPFTDGGGDVVRIGSGSYVVLSRFVSEDDDVPDGITIQPGLGSAVSSNERVVLMPEAEEKLALISVEDNPEDALEVLVPYEMKDIISDGIRDYEDQESVQLELRDQRYVLSSVEGKTPVIESQYLDIDPVTEQDAEEIRQALEEARQNAQTGIEEAKQAAAEADEAATEAYAAAGLAELIAKSKTTNYPPTSSPPAVPNGGHKIGDTWQDSTKGNLQHTWDGTSWVPVSLGSKALDDFIMTARKQYSTKHILY